MVCAVEGGDEIFDDGALDDALVDLAFDDEALDVDNDIPWMN